MIRVRRFAGIFLLLVTSLLAGGCASLPQRDPLHVTVAGIEPLQGEGMELRLLVKLRVLNPNDEEIAFNGAAINFDVQGKTFASGATDQAGTVPRFGETIVSIPVTVSMLRMVRQFMGMLDGKPIDRINYELSGKLSGASLFGTHRFAATGDFSLPKSVPAPSET